MVVALFALSLVMIVGGVASVVQGFPYVRLESGLAMVIGGATAASAGVILLGLAAVVMRLRRLEDVFQSLRGAQSDVFEPPQDIGPLRVSAPPALAGAAAVAEVPLGAGRANERRDSEPTFEAQAPSLEPADRFVSRNLAAEIEPPLPDLLPPEEPATIVPARTTTAEPEAIDKPEPLSPEEDLFASPEPSKLNEDKSEPPALRPSLEEPPVSEAPAASEQPETKASPAERQVVGTHKSGDDTYVMFADGSIEAHTPDGRLAFGSLDELRAWKASERETRAGAA